MFFWRFGWLNEWKNCQTPYVEWQKLKFCVHPLLLFFHDLRWIICEDIYDLRLKVSQKEWHVKLKTDDWKCSDTTLCWLFFIQASKMFSFVDDIFFTKPKKNFELDSAKFTKIRCWVWLFQQSKKWKNSEECHPRFFFLVVVVPECNFMACIKTKKQEKQKNEQRCVNNLTYFLQSKIKEMSSFHGFFEKHKKVGFLHFRLDCWGCCFKWIFVVSVHSSRPLLFCLYFTWKQFKKNQMTKTKTWPMRDYWEKTKNIWIKRCVVDFDIFPFVTFTNNISTQIVKKESCCECQFVIVSTFPFWVLIFLWCETKKWLFHWSGMV